MPAKDPILFHQIRDGLPLLLIQPAGEEVKTGSELLDLDEGTEEIRNLQRVDLDDLALRVRYHLENSGSSERCGTPRNGQCRATRLNRFNRG